MRGSGLQRALRIGAILFIVAALLVWLLFGEPGVFGRFNTLGFAFCHQLPTRTPSFGGVACPLCYRCSGLFLGIAVGFSLFRRRAVSFRSLLGPVPMIGAVSAIIGGEHLKAHEVEQDDREGRQIGRASCRERV